MSEAIQSPIVSRLFTQGRHSNASIVLLLQNMFPKGKFNTDISQNAQYMALFCSPSDRKQIDVIAERMFDKNRQRFMAAYYRETEKPYGYIFVDNRPNTPGKRQVSSKVFGSRRVYPAINKSLKPEEKVEAKLPKDLETTASCATQFSRRTHKYFDPVSGLPRAGPQCKIICNKHPIAKPFQKDLVSRKCTPLPEILSIPGFLQYYMQERDTSPSS